MSDQMTQIINVLERMQRTMEKQERLMHIVLTGKDPQSQGDYFTESDVRYQSMIGRLINELSSGQSLNNNTLSQNLSSVASSLARISSRLE